MEKTVPELMAAISPEEWAQVPDCRTIAEQYISVLSDEDLFYLLQAIQKRSHSKNLNENLANAAKIAAGIGLLAALFGLGLPWKYLTIRSIFRAC
jgi:hypothetical protein